MDLKEDHKMGKLISSFIFFWFFLFFPPFTYAGINSDLNNFFTHLGFDANISNPSAYKGQEAGYYTGGSIFARDTVRDLQIVQVDIPTYRSGCGGIDLFAGGFSFVNADQLVAMFKNVLNNAKGYAFTLAMESATPEIANVMKWIQDKADEINRANVNSCETAAGLVGSLWPRTQVAQQHVCADIGTSKGGIFDDYAAARQGCSAGGKLTEVLNSAKGPYKNLVLQRGNIAWKAIQQNDFLKRDTELAELFMSLSGSIIIQQNGSGDQETNQFSLLPSLAANEKLLKALLHGGNATVYKCDETGDCLSPHTASVTIDVSNSLDYQVKILLQDIARKVHDDVAITKTEIGLLQATRLPVYKILNVQAAFYQDSNILDVTSYSEVIAMDILFQYLNENLDIIKASSGNLQYPEDIMQKFMAGVDKARDAIRAEQKNAYSQIAVTTQLIQQTQVLEQILAGQLSSQLSQTLSWAKGMH